MHGRRFPGGGGKLTLGVGAVSMRGNERDAPHVPPIHQLLSLLLHPLLCCGCGAGVAACQGCLERSHAALCGPEAVLEVAVMRRQAGRRLCQILLPAVDGGSTAWRQPLGRAVQRGDGLDD
jgi:hypothetical protein